MIENDASAYKFYDSLPYDVQQMLDEAGNAIFDERELHCCVENYVGGEYS